MAATDAWSDYDNFVTYTMPKMTIPKLRMLAEEIMRISGMNLMLRSQERKADLVDRIRGAFETLRRTRREQHYLQIRRAAEEILAPNRALNGMPAPTFSNLPAPSSSFAGPSRQPATMGSYATQAAGGAPWNQPRFNGNALFNNSNYGSQNRGATALILADWKTSPLWKPVKALSGMEMLPDILASEQSSTRKFRRTTFQLSPDIIELLNKSKNDPSLRPVYSVRLFSTSSEWYRPTGAGAPGAPTNRQMPIEYPVSPDVAVDDIVIPFKDRGLRGKAGSAPPLDLDKSSRGLVRIPGRMATVMMGHTGPTTSKRKEAKKFWFQIVFCEMTPMDDILARLEALTPTDAAAEQKKMREQNDEDDDFEVGPSHLSLKDALSGMRISKPVRSSKCSHLQCFDARWWLEANKSHPQWLCPRCSKELQLSDIICDGYFLSILKATPDDYDEVVLESNGDWHTADGNYGTAEWLAANGGGTAATTAEPEPVKRARSTSVDGDSPPAKRAAIEILSDSDDSDEVPLKTVSVGPGFAPKAPATAVIDLTLSDSDSDSDYEPPAQTVRRPPPQPPRNGGAAAAPPAQERRFAAPPSQTLPPPSQTLPPPPEPEVGAFSFSDALRMGLDMSRAHGGAPVHCPTLPPVLVSAEQLALPGNHLPHPNGQYLPHPAGPQGHMPMRTTYPPNGH